MMHGLKREEEKVILKRLASRLIDSPKINEWEKEFLLSIDRQIISGDLTDKQMKVLEKIRKKCGH